jgi:hypothetical protein
MRDVNITKWAGKPDANLYTDHFESNRTVERRGYTVPTFDELLTGLKYLPTGIHARGLTQCLIWYLNNRDMFNPRLEFNVLHTQSLMRVLQIPVKKPGNRNLDMVALQEWKDHGKFTENEVEHEKKTCGTPYRAMHKQAPGPKLFLNMQEETVSLKVDLKLRHILILPYMAIGGLYCELLEWGIEKMEQRQKDQKGVQESAMLIGESPTPETEEAVKADDFGDQEADDQAVDRVRKRALEVCETDSDHPAKKQAMLLKQVLYSKAQGLTPMTDSEKVGN